jgi:hypothetical protein
MFKLKKSTPSPSVYDQFTSRLDAAIADALDSRIDVREVCDLLNARENALRIRWANSAPLGQAW